MNIKQRVFIGTLCFIRDIKITQIKKQFQNVEKYQKRGKITLLLIFKRLND